MTSKHTPGKWIVGNRNGYNPSSITALVDDNMLNDRVVADILGIRLHCSIKDIEPSEELSNAHLIAAAPDLLEALEGLHDHLADYIKINHLGSTHHNQCMQMARDAIRKAKGET